jgi:hypothetical protein
VDQHQDEGKEGLLPWWLTVGSGPSEVASDEVEHGPKTVLVMASGFTTVGWWHGTASGWT